MCRHLTSLCNSLIPRYPYIQYPGVSLVPRPAQGGLGTCEQPHSQAWGEPGNKATSLSGLLTFQLNAPVVALMTTGAFSRNIGKLCSELKLVTDIYRSEKLENMLIYGRLCSIYQVCTHV